MKKAIMALLVLGGLAACDDGAEGNLDPDSEEVPGPNAEDPLEAEEGAEDEENVDSQ